MAQKLPLYPSRRNHRRYILCLLLLMILVNLAIRYPLDHSTPQGSDTFVLMDLGRSIDEMDRANWILSPMSYFGLFPLSYPSGIPFLVGEYHMMSDSSWNSIPLVFSLVLTVLVVLSGFMLFRTFRLSDELSALLSGLMAFTPLFTYFSYQEVSARGFLIPIFMLSLVLIFWFSGNIWTRLALFLLLLFGSFSIHRSSVLIVAIDAFASVAILVGPFAPRVRPTAKMTAFAACLIVGFVLMIWPFVPGLRDVFNEVPQLSFSYRVGQFEFRTGFFFSGNSPIILLANLVTNYIGSLGLLFLLFPLGLLAVYPVYAGSAERDVFIIAVILMMCPVLWQAIYIQIMLLPFAYLLVGLALQRAPSMIRRLRERRVSSRHRLRLPRVPRRARGVVFALFIVACVLFSSFMFWHRLSLVETVSGNQNWPTDSQMNLGIYIGAFNDERHEVFVTASDLLDRRIAWISDGNCPITDSVKLRADGYLNATKDDFIISSPSHNPLSVLLSFFDFKSYYDLSPSSLDRNVYALSYEDIYGFFHLYFRDLGEIYSSPGVSTTEAHIQLVVVVNMMGNSAHNLYMGEGVIHSRFLDAVTSNCYSVFQTDANNAYIAALPV